MISFKLEDGVKLPKRGSAQAAGLDICANELVTLYPNERKLVKTGVHLAHCEVGLYLRVAPRSKLAMRYGLDVLAGVVDSDYRGAIRVLLHNTGDEIISFKRGDAIAQLIPTLHADLEEIRQVDKVLPTYRGSAGIEDRDLRL